MVQEEPLHFSCQISSHVFMLQKHPQDKYYFTTDIFCSMYFMLSEVIDRDSVLLFMVMLMLYGSYSILLSSTQFVSHALQTSRQLRHVSYAGTCFYMSLVLNCDV